MPSPPTARFSSLQISLRTKSFVLMGAGILMVCGFYLLVSSRILLGSLDQVRDELTGQRINLIVRQLNQIVREQRRVVLDNAVWDETYDALKGDPKGYLERNYSPSNNTAGQNLVLLFDRKKNLFASRFLPGGLRVEKNPPSYFDAGLLRNSGLLQDSKTGSAVVSAPDSLLVLATHPVTRTGDVGPSAGWLVFGLSLDAEWFEEMRNVTGVVITSSWPPARPLRETLHQTLQTDALGECRVFISRNSNPAGDPEGVTAWIEFANSLGGSPAVLKLKLPSALFSTAVSLRNRFVSTSLGAGFLSLLVSLGAIEFLFLRRINRMDREFQSLADRESAPEPHSRVLRDELSRLEDSTARLLDGLRQQRQESENQEHLLSSVLDSASEGIMAFRSLRNDKGTISDFVMVMANRAAETIFQRRSADMFGRSLLGLFPGNLSRELFERYVQVVETRLGEDFEIFYNQDEIREWLRISMQPWKDGFVATFELISQSKRVEQELQASVGELERFNRAMIGREYRILEMKTEVNRLRERLGLPPGYNVDSNNDEL